MAKNSPNSAMIRVPNHLKARLEAAAEQLTRAYEKGQTDRVQLTEQGTKGAWCPLHEVIRLALDEFEDHKARSRRPRKSK